MAQTKIPLHNFLKDDERSIPFKLMPLEYKESYDTSVPHRHNYYEVFLFIEGGGFHDIDFQAFEIKDNSIHFVSPGQVHLVRRELQSRGYVIFFSRDFYYLNLQDKNILFELPFLNNNTKRPILDLDVQAFQELLSLFQSIEREYNGETSFKEELIRSYLNIMLIASRRLFKESDVGEATSSSSTAKLFRQFKILLEENFDKLHQVQDYAGLMAITEKYLNELCKKTVGKTASELIHERIILEAKRLLLHSDLNNKEIAFMLSFEDPSHFSKFFKRKAGSTPTQFRKGLQEKYRL